MLERREASATGAAEAAQAVALSALVFLLEDTGRTSRFLSVTGLEGHELAQRIQDPAFLGGVLDFILEDETLLVAVAGAAGVQPERVAGMRQRLPGFVPSG